MVDLPPVGSRVRMLLSCYYGAPTDKGDVFTVTSVDPEEGAFDVDVGNGRQWALFYTGEGDGWERVADGE